MTKSSADSAAVQELELSFESGDASLNPTPCEIGLRSAYYHLVNIDEYPEMLPLAQQVVVDHVQSVRDTSASLPTELVACKDDASALQRALDSIQGLSAAHPTPWNDGDDRDGNGRVMHFFRQYTPTALVDGCWLQGGIKVPLAHTEVGSRLALLYAHTVRPGDPNGHWVEAYRALFQRLGSSLESATSRAFVERRDLLDFGFELPVLLLSLSQLPRAYLPELLGVNLAWQYLGKTTFGAMLLRDAGTIQGLVSHDDHLCDLSRVQKGQAVALDAAEIFLRECSEAVRNNRWRRLWCGLAIGVSVWMRWIDAANASCPLRKPDSWREMVELVRRKAPHAHGYHREKQIGDRRIDDWLNPDAFEPESFLHTLARSRFIVPGDPEKSPFLRDLVQLGGRMVRVFSESELQTIRNWIHSLPTREEVKNHMSAEPTPEVVPRVQMDEQHRAPHRTWSHSSLRQRSYQQFSGCSARELYYHLVNVEFFPDILPVAEQFVRDRLERAACTIHSGERPLPCAHYDLQALESWVYAQHRRQVDSYRPFEGTPRQSKEEYIESATQLAPLILIDGSWIQNVTNPAIIHTSVGRMLFGILFDEVGLGDSRHHHANLYRELLAEMGGNIPPFDSMDFALWTGFQDSSFDVPVFWLGISCFPRRFLPEILGLNLAVEIAGIGGPYLEAYDTLKYFGFNTWFVEVHNAADNVSEGHTACAMKAIETYMDDIATREGPHSLDQAWFRVWAGLRSTLPQCSRIRVMAHRLAVRLFGNDRLATPY
jgi:hypothetical protein